jgi:hypothetical protein
MALICGDSNVIKYLPLLKERKSDPSIQATTVARATNVVLLRDLLSKPTEVQGLVIISAVTNIITSKYFDDFDAMSEYCRTTFNDVILWIQEGREAIAGFAETVSQLLLITKNTIPFDKTRYLNKELSSSVSNS